MGYETYYSLHIFGPKAPLVLERLDIIADGDLWDDVNHAEWGSWAGGLSKWYNSEEDVQQLSTEFPDVRMTLEGDGEETEDHWKIWFLGGKKLCYQAVWDPPVDDVAFTQVQALPDPVCLETLPV